MVLIFPEGSWREALPDSVLQCTDPFCRGYERDLRLRLYHAEVLKDDNVVDDKLYSPIVVRDSGWGLGMSTTRPEQATGAAHYEAVIRTEADAAKIQKPRVRVDTAETERLYQQACELAGGVMPVAKRGAYHMGFAIIDLLAQWRCLDQIYLDMVDRPEWLHGVLDFMTTAMLERLDALECQGGLSLNNGPEYCGSGGVGFSSELPQPDFDGQHVRAMDLWGFATTQMFSEVSPGMHDEFALTYEKRWLGRFGLNAYGCCEPLHRKLDDIFKVPRLRRISLSPWVDMAMSAEKLGARYIFSRKPNPAIVAGMSWDPDHARRTIRDDLEKTRGCIVELVMKDTHTCQNDPRRLAEWVRIAREEAEPFAG
jgi:hypothetical protein